ncbi:MAG: hypothetical protein VX879_04845 [Pseudomonadota bacterium]|nr:hypothetical protein [Pseudomonadota bacterium]
MSLDLAVFWGNLAAIFGAISIFTTLIFVVIELRKNFEQFRLIREIHLHDVQNQYYLFWSQPKNAELVLKGSKNFNELTDKEKFSFENYVEFRIRFFSFGFNIVDKKLVGAQNSRIKYFFADAGVRSCYEKMNKEGRIPPLWSEVIERAI